MFQLNNSPTDGISCLRFAPTSNTLIASSWDSTLYLYTIDTNSCIQTYKSRGPILCCDFISESSACSGGLDKDVKIYDLMAMKEFKVGKHNETISCMRYSPPHNSIISASWDGCISLWDSRCQSLSSPLQQTSLRPIVSERAKAYSMDLQGDKLNFSFLIATNTLQIVQYDMRQLSTPTRIHDSSLSYNLRCVCSLNNNEGFAASCIEGRVCVNYYNTDIFKSFCFKCHRQGDIVYSVDAMAIHPSKSCLVTGGGNKVVSFWNYKSKKRITQIHGFKESIASLAFNADGSLLAIASSNMYENGKPEYMLIY